MFDIITIVLTAVYGLILNFFPDLPLPKEVFIALVVWILAKFGLLKTGLIQNKTVPKK